MTFRSPLLLTLLLLSPLAIALARYAATKRQEALSQFLGDRETEGNARLKSLARSRMIRIVLVSGSLALFAIAMAGPRSGEVLQDTRTTNLDLIVALDVSESMLAEDISPNRLERAKLELRRLAEVRQGDRLGLVVFAGDAFLQSPLTTDHGAFALFLEAAGPDLVGTPGTDFSQMITVARKAFSDDSERPRALLVVSDGENHEPGLDEAANALRTDGIETLTIGIGSEEGAPIPIPRTGRAAFKRDARGNQIITQYSGDALAQITGNGNVYRLERGSVVSDIRPHLDRLSRATTTMERVPAEAELFQWPLAFGLLLLLLERIMATRNPAITTFTRKR